jgi:hypothetical protein
LKTWAALLLVDDATDNMYFQENTQLNTVVPGRYSSSSLPRGELVPVQYVLQIHRRQLEDPENDAGAGMEPGAVYTA